VDKSNINLYGSKSSKRMFSVSTKKLSWFKFVCYSKPEHHAKKFIGLLNRDLIEKERYVFSA
jgi:hypothetical protein